MGNPPMTPQWISIKVHPAAGKDVLVSLGNGRFEAWLREKPIGGAVNEALVGLVGRSLRITPARIRLVKGRSGRHKVFRIV